MSLRLTRRRAAQQMLLGGLATTTLIGSVRAQKPPVEGVNYVRLAEPVPVSTPGKIEVIEFFWYECPHCNAFEPALEAWTRRLPEDVAFRRVPIWFSEVPFSAQQRIFYALEGLGLLPTMHRRVFYAIHNDHVRLRSPEEIAAFMARNGVDPDKFMAAYNSFQVQSKAQQARQLAAAYKIDAVPAMGVQGRYYTNGNLANAGAANATGASNDKMLGVVDALIAKVRPGRI